jgi:hypothetical protein
MAIAVPRITARDIIFKIGATEYAPQLNSVELTLGDAPGGIQTFSEIRVSGEWALTLSGYTSNEDTSLYRLLWTNFGSTAAFIIQPQTGTVGADCPQYTGTVLFNELPPLTLTSNEEVAFTVTLRVKNTGLDVASNLYYGVTLDTTP